MNSFSNLFLRENLGQLILCILFIIYLLMGTMVPRTVASLIDTIYGKIIIVIVALILFVNFNPILGVLGFIVAYELLRHASMSTGSYGLEKYMPTETKKYSEMTALNQFPYTLEQEVVKKMAPIKQTEETMTPSKFHPVLDNLHDAASVNYTGVI